MRLLLDTHIFVWALTDDERLPTDARHLILDPTNTRAISVASVWEISIKTNSGRWPEAAPLLGDLDQAVEDLAASLLPIDHIAAIEAGRLDWSHRDPFDRMIAAQACIGNYDLVTIDREFSHAGVKLAL